ncbi:hypothetical protein D9613_012574 [Agrocybe pediades]|uniref:DUF300-domain-containing protein n=1 Tax=Agrocybe pediades TaxID=84607 RepID=A0A8H4R1F3_9AGAR|nr:hypothetical protein D9613_012574 [Agrocybe pediades]
MTNAGGAGSRLPTWMLLIAGISTAVAVVVSMMSIFFQIRNYRKPALQRMVVRIMVMVPLYAISSLISLFSVEAAFFIDAIRDIYEAFVIYCFFVLLLTYLGGERSLLILLQGRPPKDPVFPLNLFKREIDVSDPYTFLFLKRGILQYVQVKPILAAVTLILKATGKYNEGDFRANSGYLYVSIIYNLSICLSLYCLAMFWVCVNDDLKPFRPVPKFLCVKGILFFSFWQSVAISTLVAAEVITRLGPYTDPENVSVGLNDLFICVEMPFFAIAHMYAFPYRDFLDPNHTFVARMPMYYAFRDAFGLMDVIEDAKATLRGEGMDYREFEPAEGFMHQGIGRERRIKAGLRYSRGGQLKYWLPTTTEESRPPGRAERVTNNAIKKIIGPGQTETVHAPLLSPEADDVVHLAPDLQDNPEDTLWDEDEVQDGYALPFGDIDEADEELYEHSKKYLFGDYNYPAIDVSSESARTLIWQEEERVLRDERGAWFSPLRGAKGQAALQNRDRPVWEGYGAVSTSQPAQKRGSTSKSPVSYDDSGSNQILIDHDQERFAKTAAKSPSDVGLSQWAKTRRKGPHNSHSPSPLAASSSTRHTPSSSPGNSGSASGSGSGSPGNQPNIINRIRSPSNLSRSNSRNDAKSPVLPPDAVDLVVEDPEAADEGLAHERRKGESTRSTGLRKVYRRGFVTEDEDGKRAEGEVEVELPKERNDSSRLVDVGEEVADEVESEEERKASVGAEWSQEVEGVVARSGTPPLHARIQTHHYHDIPEDDNPWA